MPRTARTRSCPTADQALAAIAGLEARGLPPTARHIGRSLGCGKRLALELRRVLVAEGRVVLPAALAHRTLYPGPVPASPTAPRVCATCGQLGVTSDFGRNRSFPDGYTTQCKGCANRVRRAAYAAAQAEPGPVCTICGVYRGTHDGTPHGQSGPICGQCRGNQMSRRATPPAPAPTPTPVPLKTAVDAGVLAIRLQTRRFDPKKEDHPLLPILNAAEAAFILPRKGRDIWALCWLEIVRARDPFLDDEPPAAPRGPAPRPDPSVQPTPAQEPSSWT